MKLCPNCRSSYADDTLKYCLQDGTTLTGQFNAEEIPTVGFGMPTGGNETEEITREFSGVPATERFSPSGEVNRIVIEPPGNSADPWKQGPPRIAADTFQTAMPGSSRTLVAVLATVVVMLLLFGAAGIGAWLYFSQKTMTDAGMNGSNTNSSGPSMTNTAVETNAPPLSTPGGTPKLNATPGSTPTAAPTAYFDPERVRGEVTQTVFEWKAKAESRDLDSYMSCYADTVDYYNKRGANISFVQKDKQKAFEKYHVIRIAVDRITVIPDATGRNATAEFDKEWYFGNNIQISEGKVRTQLKLARTDFGWKITGERDLKVYYVR